MIELKQYRAAKEPTWIITITDSEGMHRQLIIKDSEMQDLFYKYILEMPISNGEILLHVANRKK